MFYSFGALLAAPNTDLLTAWRTGIDEKLFVIPASFDDFFIVWTTRAVRRNVQQTFLGENFGIFGLAFAFSEKLFFFSAGALHSLYV